MKALHAFAAISLLSCLISTAAAHSEKYENGHRHSLDGHHQAMKEEYWDGNCKVKRKWKRNGDYKEERKCKGGRYHRHVDYEPAPGVVVILPPWFSVESGEPEYTHGWEPAPRTSERVPRCNSKQVGNVLGGLIGGVLGHQIGGSGNTVATIGGAIAGVLIGGEIGKRMDAHNQACVAQALEFAPEGQRITWQSPNGSEQYIVTPGTVARRGDLYCRSYTAEINNGGQQRSTSSMACRRPDGTWEHAT